MDTDVDWDNEKQREWWRESWQKAAQTYDLDDGLVCRAFTECSHMTQRMSPA